MKGTIKRIKKDKGFGFIFAADGNDYYFHASNLVGTKFAYVGEGDQVEFEIFQDNSGRFSAKNVVIIKGSPIVMNLVMASNVTMQDRQNICVQLKELLEKEVFMNPNCFEWGVAKISQLPDPENIL